MSGRFLLALAAAVVFFLGTQPILGADRLHAAGPAAGRLTGRFVLTSGVERPAPVHLKSFAGFLLEEVEWLDETVLVSKERRIADVVVYAVGDGFPRDPPSPDDPTDSDLRLRAKEQYVSLKFKPWRFDPHVLPMRTTHSLFIVNGMNVAGSARIEPPGEDSFNPLLPAGSGLHLRFSKPQTLPVRVSNDILVWMCAYILPLDHPYFAVSRKDGTFEIAGLPVGREIEFQLWHEHLGPVVTKRTPGGRFRMRIKPGENKLGDFEFEP
jgi:hypothetical protein